ncbi:VanZ family protein [Anoxybacillus rupiensis]|jgi:glycopeptide antibiotics resistance protein|uniref:VanZ family protein n=1 Tax=Anoxybacteroides rupiense TaxID=311460 RepID=A0ABT5W6D0_9BACL|nr:MULTISPECIES: VanZ family protein [Anoxybacillus]MDE8564889.1 VanZ family protein [Anoxybacillus rupiensis]
MFLLFFPIYIDPKAIDTSQPIAHNINIIPFASLIDMAIFAIKHGYYMSLVTNIVGNTLLLFPLSFYLTVLWDRLKSVKTAFISSISIPILIELIQLIENIFQGTGRKVDIDDVMLNGIGFFIGYRIAVQLYSPLKEILSQSSIRLKKTSFITSAIYYAKF